jgi:hypothetical protein
VGLALVLLVIGGFFYLRARARRETLEVPAGGEGVEIEEKASELAEQLGVQLPDDVEKVELVDVSGGAASGIATRKFIEGEFSHSVLAALPDPEPGSWYEGWLVRQEPFEVLFTGILRMAKGGYVLDYSLEEDLTDHGEVIVTLEGVDDQKPEQHILEGSF